MYDDVIHDLAVWCAAASKELEVDLHAATQQLETHPKGEVLLIVCVVVVLLAAERDRSMLPGEIAAALGEPAGFAAGYEELLEFLADPTRNDLAEVGGNVPTQQAGTWMLDMMYALTLLCRDGHATAADVLYDTAREAQRRGLLHADVS